MSGTLPHGRTLRYAHQHGEHGDGKHRERRAQEDALRHQPLILVELQAEHHAVDADGHAAEDDSHLQREGIDGGNGPEHGIDHRRHQHQAHEAGSIGKAAAEHGALGHGGQRAAHDDERDGDGHIAAEMEEPCHQGRRVHPGKRQDDGDGGGDDAGTEHALRADSVAGLAAGYEDFANGVHQKVERDGQNGRIEQGTVTEDGGDGGEAHKGDVAESGHEAQLPADIVIRLPPNPGDEVGQREDDGVVHHRDPQEADNLLAAEDEAVAHDAREDEHGTRDIQHKVRHLLVEIGFPEAGLRAEEADHYDAEEQEHLR